jgi:mRNA interferase MazF
MIREGQIILFAFPQTNQVAGSLRPALVLRQLPGDHDGWLVCMISTRIHRRVASLDEVATEADSEFAATGLKKSSVNRVTRLAVVAGSIFQGTIGRLTSTRVGDIRQRLANWIEGDGNRL